MVDLHVADSSIKSDRKHYDVDPLLSELSKIIWRETSAQDPSNFHLRGLWRVDYRYRPNALERDLAYSMVYAQARRIGCAYVDFASHDVDDLWLGSDSRKLSDNAPAALRIAALDTAFAELGREPSEMFHFEGDAAEKAVERARIICSAVIDEARRRGARRLLNVGVMGNFVPWLREAGMEYVGSDYDPALISGGINGSPVLDGQGTLDAIADADIVLATGMTLSTGTLSTIIDSCKQSKAALVLFAATGSFFAQTYCRELGVDVVLAEPQPQYMFTGSSRIELHRAP
ncbi:Rossmann-like domain-containing protein [Salinarimonas ramus]|uniref:Putative heavy-metal chelation domain-containing protein n=1 Tax=Salinarimonas ramus TaxID=690164 RepID=A0A917QLV8_9HYPH|nr:DUF364 domain-containing protein [Salinarimonas ramus]GGK55461.1 hypothetical protein GCM10011322_47630 [Salinarimonas ramus]